MIARRSFLTGLAAAFAAPAIVKASSLMSVKAMPSDVDIYKLLAERIANAEHMLCEQMAQMIYGASYSPVLFSGFESRVSFEPRPFEIKQVAVNLVFKR